MAVEKIVTLCKEGDSTTEYYPNIKGDNIPSNAVAKGKLTQALQDEIDGKAPQSTTYTKTEIDNKLSGKVNVATYNAKVSELETAIGTKANASDVYTKTATDTLLSAKANSSDVFTKSEINTLLTNGYYNQTEIDLMLEDKANASDVYTKTAIDTLLNDKANTSDVYTKTATDTLLSGKQDIIYKHLITIGTSHGDYLVVIFNRENTAITISTLYTKVLAYYGDGVTGMIPTNNPLAYYALEDDEIAVYVTFTSTTSYAITSVLDQVETL